MLFRRRIHEGIAEGTITLAFRRWQRPSVRAGTTLRTASGVVVIDEIARVAPDALTADDARRAGYESLAELRSEVAERADRPLYRIELHHGGPDPRQALRARDELGAAELAELNRGLARIDARSRSGAWTIELLELIEAQPGVRAAELAASRGEETQALKRRVRRLKELGLTESLETGYRLSPRGRALLARRRVTPER